MKISNRIADIFVGAVVLAVIVFFWGLLNGEDGFETVSNLYSFAAISVFCTGGVALVFWIPSLLAIGGITTGIISFFSKKNSTNFDNTGGGSIKNISSNSQLAIVGYIVTARGEGNMDDNLIRTNLKSGGWGELEIDAAFNKCSSGK